ncbi:hypothetical protein IDH44_00470 [Paenibacillus sp. IB182496]|uniref:Uncharacterized protein n=1 Tax=Paenibacillus sabuli TaxID=2772509 RepID=A0A927GQD5_9BACL|nr:hypothetical protein [Paenibacillus sabuli]MBD2843647.1 hypothetical protein [Paenibacillus sabuli]
MDTKLLIAIIVGLACLSGAFTVFIVSRMIAAARQTMRDKKEVLASGVTASARIRAIHQTQSSMDGRSGVKLELTVIKTNGER